MKFNRIHVIVMDSVGIGQAPDAHKFDDVGCDTLGHISGVAGLKVPNMEKMGLGSLGNLPTVANRLPQQGYCLRLEEESVGKDTMTGHWELMGLTTHVPFPTFPEGFSKELLDKIEQYSGRKILCNKPYSGTQVLEDYGPQQLETGALIVYTSADPVLQIAAHEEIIPLEELYDICKYVRSITLDNPRIGRIIARPYVGTPGNFTRTPNRHDYALNPGGKTTLDQLKDGGYSVLAIGKINDIFNGCGITGTVSTKSNMDGVEKLLADMKTDFTGITFLNLVDFDAVYGHRRDVTGYGQALEDFDARLPEIMGAMQPNDLLLITADHGNDPTFKGTDHTREYVPLLCYSPAIQGSGKLADGKFSDLGATLCDNFGVQPVGGSSFLKALL